MKHREIFGKLPRSTRKKMRRLRVRNFDYELAYFVLVTVALSLQFGVLVMWCLSMLVLLVEKLGG